MLSHFSDKPFELDRQREYVQREDMKPSGIWVSVDGEHDWQAWCEAENFRTTELLCRYRVTLTPDARILRLPSAFDIDLFTERYRGSDPTLRRYQIDWTAVARDYQGVIIAPYCWERRLEDHTSWYYGWDCASGCIWDLAAVQSLVLLEDSRDCAEGVQKEASAC